MGSAGLLLVCSACSYVATPRIEDAPALHDYAREAKNEREPCDRRIDVLEPPQVDEGAYRTIGTLSATCYPGARAVCERSLRARACELGADVVVVMPSTAGAVPVGASGQSLTSMTARALQLEAKPGTGPDGG